MLGSFFIISQFALEPKTAKELTAMASAFTVGLIEIHYADHLEAKKGLDNQEALFASFIDLLLH